MAHREVVITKVAPMSAFRVGLALSLVGLVAWVICVAILYVGLDATGVWNNVNSVIGGVGGETEGHVWPGHERVRAGGCDHGDRCDHHGPVGGGYLQRRRGPLRRPARQSLGDPQH